LEEIESLLPSLNENAKNLRSQADVLQDYCSALEDRQSEMRRIVENAFNRSQASPPSLNANSHAPAGAGAEGPVTEIIDMSPR
jgi:hypothetical protein